MEDNYEFFNMFDTTELEKNRKKEEKRAKKRAKKLKTIERKQKIVNGLMTAVAVGVPTVMAVTPVVKMITNAVISANRRAAVKTEQESKEIYCYDRSLGHYWELKRKLTNSDWMKINSRKANGESLADILTDMDVLKK